MSKVFIDTNILVYTMDGFDKKKRTKCRSILKKIISEQAGVISTQVLQEFYVTATKKLKVDPLDAKRIIHTFNNFEIISVNLEILNEAIDCSVLNKLSFWDSLIICSAEFAYCEFLWTEDLNPGQLIRGVKVINPIVDHETI